MDLLPQHRDLVIRTVLGEAGGESDRGRAAVAHVIRNRIAAGQYGDNAADVILAPNQFEPWSRPDARARMQGLSPDSPIYQKLGGIVDQVFGGQASDPTGGATHFFSPTVQASLGRKDPAWGQGEGVTIGTHRFLAPEGRVNVDPSWRPPVGDTGPSTQPVTTATTPRVGTGAVATATPTGSTTAAPLDISPSFGSLAATPTLADQAQQSDTNFAALLKQAQQLAQPQQAQVQPLQPLQMAQRPVIDLRRLRAAIGRG